MTRRAVRPDPLRARAVPAGLLGHRRSRTRPSPSSPPLERPPSALYADEDLGGDYTRVPAGPSDGRTANARSGGELAKCRLCRRPSRRAAHPPHRLFSVTSPAGEHCGDMSGTRRFNGKNSYIRLGDAVPDPRRTPPRRNDPPVCLARAGVPSRGGWHVETSEPLVPAHSCA